MSSPNKPLVVAIAFPVHGHTIPVLNVLSHLVKNNFEAWFIGGKNFEHAALKAGATRFIPGMEPFALRPNLLEGFEDVPPGFPRVVESWNRLILPETGLSAKLLGATLEEAVGRQVVVLQDSMAGGPLPYLYGAPLPKGYSKFPPVASVNSTILFCTSVDIPPPVLPVTSGSRDEIKRLNREFEAHTASTMQIFNRILEEMGCKERAEGNMADIWFNAPDVTFQMCSPSLEYKRSDVNPKIRMVGGLPLTRGGPLPEGLRALIEDNSKKGEVERKRVVFVTQGTEHVDYSDLVIPTIQGLAARDDVMVVVALGKKDTELPADFQVPENTIVCDWIDYNSVLKVADVFVTNAGYGGFIQAVMNGVPIVVAGEEADKAEVSKRVEYAGLGVNLDTSRPSAERVATAVERVLANKDYKNRAQEIRIENEEMDSLGQIQRAVEELLKK